MIENAKRFFEELGANEKAQELLRAAGLEDTADDALVLAKVARETGYEVGDDDMRELLAAMQKLQAAASDAVADQVRDLDDEELDTVAGGGEDPACRDSFSNNDNCLIVDRCDKVIVIYVDESDPECTKNAYCHGFMSNSDCWAGLIGF